MNRRLARLISAAGLAAMTVGLAHAIPLLSQEQARAKAVAVLRGDPYGKTNAEVMGNIKQVEFLRDGVTEPCGAMKKPVWQFHVVVSAAARHIDGYLILDAQSGKMLCHNLPFLD
jgi:hypothetical protein